MKTLNDVYVDNKLSLSELDFKNYLDTFCAESERDLMEEVRKNGFSVQAQEYFEDVRCKYHTTVDQHMQPVFKRNLSINLLGLDDDRLTKLTDLALSNADLSFGMGQCSNWFDDPQKYCDRWLYKQQMEDQTVQKLTNGRMKNMVEVHAAMFGRNSAEVKIDNAMRIVFGRLQGMHLNKNQYLSLASEGMKHALAPQRPRTEHARDRADIEK